MIVPFKVQKEIQQSQEQCSYTKNTTSFHETLKKVTGKTNQKKEKKGKLI
jgi:hypothetical protein